MKRVGNERASALPEVLVSIAIFGVTVAGLAAGTMGTIKGNSASRATSVATALIHDKVEGFRALDPASEPADLAPGKHTDPLSPLDPLGRSGGGFFRSWFVTPNTPQRGLSEVVVTVTWNDPEARSLRATTYVCRTRTCS